MEVRPRRSAAVERPMGVAPDGVEEMVGTTVRRLRLCRRELLLLTAEK